MHVVGALFRQKTSSKATISLTFKVESFEDELLDNADEDLCWTCSYTTH